MYSLLSLRENMLCFFSKALEFSPQRCRRSLPVLCLGREAMLGLSSSPITLCNFFLDFLSLFSDFLLFSLFLRCFLSVSNRRCSSGVVRPWRLRLMVQVGSRWRRLLSTEAAYTGHLLSVTSTTTSSIPSSTSSQWWRDVVSQDISRGLGTRTRSMLGWAFGGVLQSPS